MANAYQRGDKLPVRWTPTGGTAVVMSITGWGGSILESLTLDVTSTSHGGGRARIGGVEDSKGNITAFVDLDVNPWSNYGIRNGFLGVLQPYVITTQAAAFTIPIIIAKVNYKSAIQEALSFNFDWELSVIAGNFQYPS